MNDIGGDGQGNIRVLFRYVIPVFSWKQQNYAGHVSIARPSSARRFRTFNPLNAELNPICFLLALLGAHHFLHFSRIRVKSLTLRLLNSYIYIYGAPILDVSRSHTTAQHSR